MPRPLCARTEDSAQDTLFAAADRLEEEAARCLNAGKIHTAAQAITIAFGARETWSSALRVAALILRTDANRMAEQAEATIPPHPETNS